MSGNSRRIALAVVVAGLALLGASAVSAQQAQWRLLMFDADDCTFCERWHREVGVIYDKTREGALAPLEITQLDAALPVGVQLSGSVRYTPTFVVLDTHGSEVGRITGYLGENQFWGLLESLLPPPHPG